MLILVFVPYICLMNWTPQEITSWVVATKEDIEYWQRVKKPRIPRKLKKRINKHNTN
jgi:predicted transcriptional regulator